MMYLLKPEPQFKKDYLKLKHAHPELIPDLMNILNQLYFIHIIHIFLIIVVVIIMAITNIICLVVRLIYW